MQYNLASAEVEPQAIVHFASGTHLFETAAWWLSWTGLVEFLARFSGFLLFVQPGVAESVDSCLQAISVSVESLFELRRIECNY